MAVPSIQDQTFLRDLAVAATAIVKPASKAGSTVNRTTGDWSQKYTEINEAPATTITTPATRYQFSVSHGWM